MTEHSKFLILTDDQIQIYGFEPWHGTKKGPPDDWKRGWKVLYRGGFVGTLSSEESYHWDHATNVDDEDRILDIIGYPTEVSLRNQTKDFSSHE